MLSDSESDAESLHRLTINEHYAKAFEYKKEREELEKLKEKYGSDAEIDDDDAETDSEEAESEDEDGEELTPAVDAAILRTLARIKRKDPEIYNTQKGIFEEEQKKSGEMKKSTRVPKDKSKPVTMRQVALDSALHATSRSPSPDVVTHVEEQRALRNETIAAFHQAVGGDDDGLLIPREKTKDEMEREEEEYRDFLQREVGEDLAELVTVDEDIAGARETAHSETPKIKKTKKAKRDKKPNEADQEFLMNYILNRGWIDRSSRHVPTYGEITESTKGKGKAGPQGDSLSEPSLAADEGGEEAVDGELDDDDFDEIVDRFESSYNFRFEEPDAAVIKSYPRNLQSIVRREDTTRKDARERRKQRKDEELAKRKEEVKRMKALKMREIRRKLEVIGREGGKDLNNDPALNDLDLDGDWDADAHDRQMADLYDEAEDGEGVDGEKPHWDDEIDIGDIVPTDQGEKKKKKKKKKHKERGGEGGGDGVDIDEMDADVERTMEVDEEWDGTEEMRKQKLDEYMDEVYGLDFNDMVGDIATRFKYATVQPQSYALTPSEILMATDAELNQYLSVKRYAPYRKDGRWDSTRNDRLKELKGKLAERSGNMEEDVEGGKKTQKRKGKKERQMLKRQVDVTEPEVSVGQEEPLHRKRKDVGDVGDEGVKGAGTGKRRRRRHKNAANSDPLL